MRASDPLYGHATHDLASKYYFASSTDAETGRLFLQGRRGWEDAAQSTGLVRELS
jgi:hypothetical protein